MKKIINLFLLLILSTSVYSQEIVDYLLKAKAITEEGKPDLAIMYLNQAVSEIKDSRLYSERADAKIIKGDYSGAISDFNEANRLTPYSGDYGLARIYALKGDARTALYHLEMNLNSSFRKGEKEVMLDPAFATIESRPEWRLFWKKDWYSAIEKGISEIEYYLSSGKSDEALNILSDLKKGYSGDDEVLYGEALIQNAIGKHNEAIRNVTLLLEKNPDNTRYLMLLAKTQLAASNPAGASVSFSKLLEDGVADAEIFIQRAGCYMKTGENEKALSDITKYLGYYPGSKTALRMAGKAELASGDNLNALKYFSDNLKLHPNDAECYTDRANSYFVSKTWDWAIKDYTMSLDLSPESPEVWLNKGIALLNSGKSDDACHDFRKSFSLGNKRASEYISKYCIK